MVRKTPTGRRVELMVASRPVSWADLFYYRLRIGRARLAMGGVANVRTEREHRMKGYGRRVLRRSVEVMTQDGLDVSLLFGIANFYERFGYRPVAGEHEAALPGRAVVNLPIRLRAREISPRDHRRTLPLYRRYLDRGAVDLERRAATWRGYVMGSSWAAQTVTVTGFFRGRAMAAYVVCDNLPDVVTVAELVAARDDDLPSVLGWLGRQCRAKMAEKITFHLAPDHPAVRLALALGATITQRTFHSGGAMLRILNLGSTLAAMRGELSARWSASPMAGRAVRITFQTDIGNAQLAIQGSRGAAGAVRGRVRISQSRLAQLLAGYAAPETLVRLDRNVHIPPRLMPAMSAIFPPRTGFILRTNRF
jgi:predicted acetyltransferase